MVFLTIDHPLFINFSRERENRQIEARLGDLQLKQQNEDILLWFSTSI